MPLNLTKDQRIGRGLYLFTETNERTSAATQIYANVGLACLAIRRLLQVCPFSPLWYISNIGLRVDWITLESKRISSKSVEKDSPSFQTPWLLFQGPWNWPFPSALLYYLPRGNCPPFILHEAFWLQYVLDFFRCLLAHWFGLALDSTRQLSASRSLEDWKKNIKGPHWYR